MNKYIAAVTVVALIIFLPYGCQRPETATRILIEQGYSNIELTGWRPFMAGKDDSFSTGFKAKSPSGATVTGAVTTGVFKDSTIRLD